MEKGVGVWVVVSDKCFAKSRSIALFDELYQNIH